MFQSTVFAGHPLKCCLVFLKDVSGLLLFNVCTGDLWNSIKHSRYCLFADDIKTVCAMSLDFHSLTVILFSVGVLSTTHNLTCTKLLSLPLQEKIA